MKQLILLFSTSILFFACKPQGVVKKSESPDSEITNTKNKKEREAELAKLSLKPIKKIGDKSLKNGIKITYFIHGEGEQLKKGDVAQINYEVLLKNGSLIDGNKLLNKDWLPFLVGFGMQTPGWDIAFKELRIGDFVEIYLPSKMARDKMEIKGLFPANSENFIRIKIVGKLNPTKMIDGTKIYLLEENKSNKKLAKEENEIDFHYYVGTESNPRYDFSYKRNKPYTFRFSDFGIVKGLKKALINAKKADKIWVVIPPAEAYGSKGLLDLVKPNEYLFYDIFIMDVR
ncbi:MAG: FKBP-type peptidyl-prolyl cis-trans isomerase [Flavobacteriia bacterium]|jgi:FKBP-type peptidyl-prolyl cis-trans isomerase